MDGYYMRHISTARSISLIALVCGVFFFQLGDAALWDRDEPRNAGAAREMLLRGDWIVPTFNGQLRDHKPVLLYWGQMAAYRMFGVSEWTARLPSALCALLTVFAVAILASRLTGRTRGISQEGYWAAASLATCALFVMAGRAATPDACLIAFSTLGIAGLVLASIDPSPPYASGRVRPARWLPAIVGYLMLGLAGLAKGPVGIILPLAVVHLWWLVCHRAQTLTSPGRNHQHADGSARAGAVGNPRGSFGDTLRVALRWSRHAASEFWQTFGPLPVWRSVMALRTVPGLLIALLAAAPWYIAVGLETDGAFLRGFFLEHNLGRATQPMEGHGGSLLFYPAAFLVGTFPWSLWLVAIVWWCRRAARTNVAHRQLVVLSGCWILVYVGAFSLASTKLPSYITPCYAGAALAIGCFLRQFETEWSVPRTGLRRAHYMIAMGVGTALAGTLFWLAQKESMPGITVGAIGGAAVAVGGLCGWLLDRSGAVRVVPTVSLIAAAALQVSVFAIGATQTSRYRQDIATLTDVQQRFDGQGWASAGGLEPSWVFYLQEPIQEFTPGADTRSDLLDRLCDWIRSHPHGRLIAVGEVGEDLVAQLQRGSGRTVELFPLAQCPRFLRPGQLTVYAWDSRSGGKLASGAAAAPPRLR
ncbi:MAG: glycosyltransferase family 39 protein [Planctomycetota bacterium]|nr:MAG: glycosyltransferase family 39 protein [Planctomycetota bacterium]